MFLNSEMILSIIQTTEIQMKAFEEFKKVYDVEEARKQTEIYIKALMSIPPRKDEGIG